jgi:lipopolysaccharide exporter
MRLIKQLKFFINILRTSNFAKNTIQLTAGTLISQAIMAISVLWLSKLYGPESFGLFALYSSAVAIFSVLISLRYETGIVVTKDYNEARYLLFLTLILALFFGIVSLSIFAIIPKIFLKSKFIIDLEPWFLIIGLSSIFGSILASFNSWSNKFKFYHVISATRVLQVLIATVLSTICGLLNFKNGLIYSQAFAVLCATAFIYFYSDLSTILIPKLSEIYKTAVKNIKLPLFLLPATTIDVVTSQLPIPLIALWFSKDMAGYYSMAWRFLGLPMAIIGGAIATVFFQKFSEVWPDRVKSKRLLLLTWKVLALIGILPTILILFYGESIAQFILGDAWSSAGIIASIMVPMSFINFVCSSTSTTYLVMGLQKYSFYFTLTSLIFRPLSLFIGYYKNDIYIGLIYFTIFEIIQMIAFQYVAWKHISSKDTF